MKSSLARVFRFCLSRVEASGAPKPVSLKSFILLVYLEQGSSLSGGLNSRDIEWMLEANRNYLKHSLNHVMSQMFELSRSACSLKSPGACMSSIIRNVSRASYDNALTIYCSECKNHDFFNISYSPSLHSVPVNNAIPSLHTNQRVHPNIHSSHPPPETSRCVAPRRLQPH